MDLLELQKTDSDCGAAVLHAVLKFHGVRCNYKRLLKLAGTTKAAGTGSPGMLQVLEHYKLSFGVLQTQNRGEAHRQLLSSPFVTILCVDNDSHWVLKIGTYEKLVIVFDPEVGTCLLTKNQLLKRWANARGDMYGIGVYRSSVGLPGVNEVR